MASAKIRTAVNATDQLVVASVRDDVCIFSSEFAWLSDSTLLCVDVAMTISVSAATAAYDASRLVLYQNAIAV